MGPLHAGDFRDATWSIADLQPQSSLTAWSELVSTEITEMLVESDEGPSFDAIWTRYGLGPLDLNFLRTGPQRVSRSAEMAARNPESYFELIFARQGRILASHRSRRCVIPPGAFLLLQDRYTYTLDFPDATDCLTVRIPENWLRAWVISRHSPVGLPLGISEAWSRPLAGLLTAIADAGLQSASLPRPVIADQIGAMCALMINAPNKQNSVREGDLMCRILNRIRERHDQHLLDPSAIAHELGISKRHLHRVLAQGGRTFGAALNEERIARARQILLDPRHSQTAIGEIAWLVGFADQSHFARLFRIRYGCAPSEFKSRSSAQPSS